jgi:NAD(P)-dependent dehydrogenase (short-subunit alcohol dehydrogenase family)
MQGRREEGIVPGRLEGKTAVVVGGGQTPGETVGNGRAVAVTFAREGARVLVVDRYVDAAEETVKLIKDEGFDGVAYEADISSESACANLAVEARATLGQIDILHNNVGIVGKDNRATALSGDDFSRIMDVNLKGMWLTCKHFLPIMEEQGHGSITNVSSIGAWICPPEMLTYTLSKLGVNGLTRTLAIEYAARGIRVNAILPGLINTPLFVDDVAKARGMERDAVAKARAAAVPMGRQGSAWEVAQAVLFLASDEASFVTGVCLPVDGGSTLLVGAMPLPAPSDD